MAFGLAPERLKADTRLTAAKSPLSTTEHPTPLQGITTYNNFYEFGTAKDDPVRNAKKFRPAPWTISIEGILRALRSGANLPDQKLEALRSLVVDVVRSRGRVSDKRIGEFLAAGYSEQNVLEVVFAVAMKILSNYVNHVTETPIDAQFMAQVWGPEFQSA
jgi:hypothetical protein